jgi:hypothetical protein
MKLGIWQQIVISSGLNAVTALIATGKLSPVQKDLAADLVSKGQAFLATFNK